MEGITRTLLLLAGPILLLGVCLFAQRAGRAEADRLRQLGADVRLAKPGALLVVAAVVAMVVVTQHDHLLRR